MAQGVVLKNGQTWSKRDAVRGSAAYEFFTVVGVHASNQTVVLRSQQRVKYVSIPVYKLSLEEGYLYISG